MVEESGDEGAVVGRVTRRRLLAGAVGLGLAGLASMPYTFTARVSRRTLYLPGLPAEWDGVTALHLTDFHRGPLVPGHYLEEALDQARRIPHEIAFFTGDFVSVSATYVNDMRKWLTGWPAPLGAFACLGNHDHWTNAAQVGAGVESAGIPVLTNRSVEATRSGRAIRIVGVDDPATSMSDLKAALAGTEDGLFRILLAHSPDIVWSLAERQVGLVLSGHTHGGQVCMPGGQAVVCPTNLGSDYAKGVFRWRGATLFVNRGLGVVGFPLRAFCPPEIALLTLRRGEDLAGSIRHPGAQFKRLSSLSTQGALP